MSAPSCRRGARGWCKRATVRWTEWGPLCADPLDPVCVRFTVPGQGAPRRLPPERYCAGEPWEPRRCKPEPRSGRRRRGAPAPERPWSPTDVTCPVHGLTMGEVDECVFECPRGDCGRQLLQVLVPAWETDLRPLLRVLPGGKR